MEKDKIKGTKEENIILKRKRGRPKKIINNPARDEYNHSFLLSSFISMGMLPRKVQPIGLLFFPFETKKFTYFSGFMGSIFFGKELTIDQDLVIIELAKDQNIREISIPEAGIALKNGCPNNIHAVTCAQLFDILYSKLNDYPQISEYLLPVMNSVEMKDLIKIQHKELFDKIEAMEIPIVLSCYKRIGAFFQEIQTMYISGKLGELLGYSREALKSVLTIEGAFELFHPSDSHLVLEKLLLTCIEGARGPTSPEDYLSFRVRLIDRSSRILWVTLHFNIYMRATQLVYCIVYITDILYSNEYIDSPTHNIPIPDHIYTPKYPSNNSTNIGEKNPSYIMKYIYTALDAQGALQDNMKDKLLGNGGTEHNKAMKDIINSEDIKYYKIEEEYKDIKDEENLLDFINLGWGPIVLPNLSNMVDFFTTNIKEQKEIIIPDIIPIPPNINISPVFEGQIECMATNGQMASELGSLNSTNITFENIFG